ncbi:hypothetical protein MMC22_002858 [Lobaria immixta]|nr:hypothetical protein [Lobaria immixta]
MEPDNFHFPDPFAFAKAQTDATEDVPGLTCEIKTYEARYDSRGDQVILQVGKRRDIDDEENRNFDSALVLTRVYDRHEELDYTELEIRSPHVKTALQKVIVEYPELNLASPKIIIRGLPKCFFHYRQELQAYWLTLQDPTAMQHLVFALEYMYQTLHTEIISYYYLMETPSSAPGLEFVNLWMAFRPGCLVYSRIDHIDAVFRLKSMTRCTCTKRHCWQSRWLLEVERLDYNGMNFGYTKDHFCIRPYQYHKRIDELRIFPFEYHPNKKAISRALVSRGRKFISLHGIHHRYYEGTAEALSFFRINSIWGEEDEFPLQSITIKSRIMIDTKTFELAKPSQAVDLNPQTKIDITKDEHLKLSEEDFLICHHKMAGLALSNKRWCFFEIDNIKEIQYNPDAFETLVLPREQKETILSLVRVHADKRLAFDDIIKGKGKGMIFLLHGVPGVGKTLTAESVADYTQKPLYVVSCGELGVESRSVEENLSYIIQLATAWDAIILIDEADVLLEQRSANNLQQNGLVSVFLRLLEYYDGILFLTTNRISAFDTAFKSRIHLAIKYHPLSIDSRRQLWKVFIARGAPNGLLHWMNDARLGAWAAQDLNGRQIKNAVRTAHALAVSAGRDLAAKDIDTALKVMTTFDADLPSEDAEDWTSHGEFEHRSKRPRRD